MNGNRSVSRLLWIGIVLGLATLIPLADGKTDEARKVPVMTLDQDGHAAVHLVPFPEFAQTMDIAFGTVVDSIQPALARNSSIRSADQPDLDLQTIAVGVGISGTLGLGPLWNATAFGRLRLVFSNIDNPLYPN